MLHFGWMALAWHALVPRPLHLLQYEIETFISINSIYTALHLRFEACTFHVHVCACDVFTTCDAVCRQRGRCDPLRYGRVENASAVQKISFRCCSPHFAWLLVCMDTASRVQALLQPFWQLCPACRPGMPTICASPLHGYKSTCMFETFWFLEPTGI